MNVTKIQDRLYQAATALAASWTPRGSDGEDYLNNYATALVVLQQARTFAAEGFEAVYDDQIVMVLGIDDEGGFGLVDPSDNQ